MKTAETESGDGPAGAQVQAELALLRDRWQAQQAPSRVLDAARRRWREQSAPAPPWRARLGWWGGAAAAAGCLAMLLLWQSDFGARRSVVDPLVNVQAGQVPSPSALGVRGPLPARPALPPVSYPAVAAARVGQVAGWSLRVPRRPDLPKSLSEEEQLL